MKYRVRRFNLKMTTDQSRLEQFLNGLEGEIIAIIPNVAAMFRAQNLLSGQPFSVKRYLLALVGRA